MTAAPTPLLERIARKFAVGTTGFEYDKLMDEQKADLCARIKPVLDACRAEEMERVIYGLLAAINAQPVVIFTEAMVDAVEDARKLGAKLEGKA